MMMIENTCVASHLESLFWIFLWSYWLIHCNLEILCHDYYISSLFLGTTISSACVEFRAAKFFEFRAPHPYVPSRLIFCAAEEESQLLLQAIFAIRWINWSCRSYADKHSKVFMRIQQKHMWIIRSGNQVTSTVMLSKMHLSHHHWYLYNITPCATQRTGNILHSHTSLLTIC